MTTIIKKVNIKNPEPEIISEAADILKKGGLVAFPTETVYGLGANGFNVQACRKIYEAKGRPQDNPLILHIAKKSQLADIVKETPYMAEKLIDVFWPGPLTLIFKKKDEIPDEITGGLKTVAVRCPKNEVAKRLIEEAGFPIAAPSANSSGKPSPTRASHVVFDLDGKIDMIIDGGPCEVGLESTIVDVSEDLPFILRPGAVTKEMLESVLKREVFTPKEVNENEAPKAPGMKYTHYSPKAEVFIVSGDAEKVCEKIKKLLSEGEKSGLKVGILASNQTKDKYAGGIVLSAGNRENIGEIASNLFKLLRKFDYLGVDLVYAEGLNEEGLGSAVMNRLYKASGYKIIKAE